MAAAPAGASSSDLDITAVFPTLITQGGNAFIENIGDQIYNMGGVKNATDAQHKIAVYMGDKNKFVETEGVQKQKNFNAFWFLVLYIMYAGYGAARISGEKGSLTQGFVVQESYTRTCLRNLLLGIAFFMFYLKGIDWLCTGEWLFSQGFVVNALNIMPNETQRGLVYLIIAIANCVVWAFMTFRDILCYMVIMYLLWLIAASKIPIVGVTAFMILLYGFVVFLSRIIIAFLFMSGAVAIESLHLGGLVIPYLILMIFIIAVCIFILILPIIVAYLQLAGGVIRVAETIRR
jgi:hypothetical protein